jgi:hypothetical protein
MTCLLIIMDIFWFIVLVMLKSRPDFEAGPWPRPIWACQARPGLGLAEARPAGHQYI